MEKLASSLFLHMDRTLAFVLKWSELKGGKTKYERQDEDNYAS